MNADAGPEGTGEPPESGAGPRCDDLRVADPALRRASPVEFSFNGTRVRACRGESIAAALAAAGIANLGRRRDASPRGLWCGMGVCQECLVEVDGRPGERACMTAVAEAMVVTAQGYASVVPAASATRRAPPPPPDSHRPQVLVVGAGPAGLAAARAAALCGAAVTVIDERSAAGGQYFKQIAKSHAVVDPERVDARVREGRALIAEVEGLGVKFLHDAVLWGAFGARELAVGIDGAQHIFAPERLVLATGAYERGVPVPGWTLPGYMTTGAAQTLLRAYRVLPGRRVLVAGNGPLNLHLAAELVAAGVDVVAVVEAAPRPGPRHALDGIRAFVADPGLIYEGLRYRVRLRRAGVRFEHASTIVAAHGESRVEACTIAPIDGEGRPIAGTSMRLSVDAVCAGHGFLPSNEVARALGCRHEVDTRSGALSTVTDGDGLTSLPGVYVIGDAVALRGAHVALAQGFITGCAIARSLGLSLPDRVVEEGVRARRQLRRHLAFQRSLWRIFAAPVLRTGLAGADTIVCRCEGVSRSAIEGAIENGATTQGEVKRRTRAGMGRCQGRYCEWLVAAMLPGAPDAPRDELSGLAPRVPVKPMRIGDLT